MKTSKNKTFSTFYNGSYTYKVELSQNTCKVYLNEKQDKDFGKLIFEQNYKKAFIEDPKDVNTILIELSNTKSKTNKYLYLGQSAYTFESVPIVKYMSPMGSENDVPYPCAIDKNGNYYLMDESLYLDKTISDNIRKEKLEPGDVYYMYYTQISKTLDKTKMFKQCWYFDKSGKKRAIKIYRPLYNIKETIHIKQNDSTVITKTASELQKILKDYDEKHGVFKLKCKMIK
jgi:hypothetical protein